MLKRILKYAGLLLLSVFVIVNVVLGYYGVSSVFLTAIVYVFIWFAGAYALKFLIKNYEARQNYLLMFSTLIAGLFAGELALKYIFKVGLQRQELKGSFFYTFPYGKPEVENFIRKLRHKEHHIRLKNYVPHTSDMVGDVEFQYLHSYNSFGLRGKEPSRDSSKINIIGLGDSFTEGVGAPQDSTYMQLLENKLIKNIPRVQCINAGLAGSEPFDEHVTLQDFLLSFKPRIVLVAVNATDITDVVEMGGWERYTNYKKAPWWAYIYQFSFIARAIIHAVHPVNWLYLSDMENKEEEIKAIEKIENCLVNDYLKLAQENNFKLIVVLHPNLFELEQDTFSLQPLAEKLQDVPAIKTINLFEAFKNAKREGDIEYKSLYWAIDGHNNSKGYQLWADTLYVQIEQAYRQNLIE